MQDSTYLDRIEISEPSEQLSTLLSMMLRNNGTGFKFSLASAARFLRVFFKNPISIALVQVLTPKSNVTQIRLSYFDENNQTINDSTLQGWQVNHVSELGRENNSIDKLCPNFLFRGIRVDILQPDPSPVSANNVTLHVYVRNCGGIGGRIRKCHTRDRAVIFLSSPLYFCSFFNTQVPHDLFVVVRLALHSIVHFILVFFSTSALCKQNIMVLEHLEEYSSKDVLSDLSRALVNMTGVSFPVVQPNVTIKFFSSDVIVSKIYAQVNYSTYPSNVAQICVTLFNSNSTRLTYANGATVPQLRSPANDPTIEGWFEGVKSILVRLCNTKDGQPPRRVRFGVEGCYASRATFIMRTLPQYSQESTTPAPCRFHCNWSKSNT